jgi:naphthalene 1,2-dioxygenase system ferredoxin subunit
MTELNAKWHLVAEHNEVEEEEIKLVEVDGRQIALCQFEDKVFAFDNICSHEEACFSDGMVTGDEVECPLHLARFCIRTGEYLSSPATKDIDTFPVKIEGTSIYIQVGVGDSRDNSSEMG